MIVWSYKDEFTCVLFSMLVVLLFHLAYAGIQSCFCCFDYVRYCLFGDVYNYNCCHLMR